MELFVNANLSTELVRTLVENLEETFERLPEWDMMSMVIDLNGKRFSGTHGYLYLPEGSFEPWACDAFAVDDVVEAFLADRYPGDTVYPLAVLVQFDKRSGKYEFTFEDTDKARWKVDPSNFKAMPEKIRPNFDDQGVV